MMTTMNKRGSKAGKFDIVRSTLSGREYVIEGHWPEWHAERGGHYQAISLDGGFEAVLFADQFEVTSRHPDNLCLDGLSELAQTKNHIFDKMRLEFTEAK